MEFKEVIVNRRSIRKFTVQPVPVQAIEAAVATASFSPSWKNSQISRYILIQDRHTIDQISAEYAPFNKRVLDNCTALIVQTYVAKRSGFERDGSFSTARNDGWQPYDCGIAAQSLCCALYEQGIGSVILGIFDQEGLQEYLQLPAGQELMALIPIGIPDEAPTAPKRKSVDELLTIR